MKIKTASLWCLFATVGACGFAVLSQILASCHERRAETKHLEQAIEVLEGEGGIVLT